MYSGHPVYNGHLTISQGWPLLTGLTEFMLGFSHHQISQVLDTLQRIFPTAGVYNLVEIWDRRHAQRILLIVSNVFQDINGHSGSYTCDAIHLTQDRFTFDLLLMSVGFLSCFWVNLLKRQIYQTGVLFGFFVSILSALINAYIFVKRAKLRTLDSICVTVSFGNVYLFRRYCTSFIMIDVSV